MRYSTTSHKGNMMRACCETGYCQSEAAAMAADEALGEGWELLAVDPEESRYVDESNVEGGEPEVWEPRLWFPGIGYRD